MTFLEYATSLIAGAAYCQLHASDASAPTGARCAGCIRVVLEKVRDEENRTTIGHLSGYQLQELEAAKGVILDAIYRSNNAKQHWLADAIEAECGRRRVDLRPSPVMKNRP